MKLALAETNLNYPIFRLLSENEKWEVGVYPTIYGVRVSAGEVGSSFYIKGGYCCGMDGTLAQMTVMALAVIVASFPEDTLPGVVEKSCPNWDARPINLDDCFCNLVTMAKERETQIDGGADAVLETAMLEVLGNVTDDLHFTKQLAHILQYRLIDEHKAHLNPKGLSG